MVKFSLRWWFSRQQILFLECFGIYHWQLRQILCGAPSSKTRAKLALSPGLAFLTLMLLVCFNFCILIYSFVCQFLLHYYWCCYNHKQLSGGVLQKRYSYKFRKIHKKSLWRSLVLNEAADLQRLTSSKKRLRHLYFLVNFSEISQNTFLIEPL